MDHYESSSYQTWKWYSKNKKKLILKRVTLVKCFSVSYFECDRPTFYKIKEKKIITLVRVERFFLVKESLFKVINLESIKYSSHTHFYFSI
jgi:hypothetical protein